MRRYTSLYHSSRLVFVLGVFLAFSPTIASAQHSSSDETTSMVASPEVSLLEQQERQIRMVVLLALIPIVIAFSFVTFIFYRRKREAYFKQTEAELKLSKAEVEIRALRAQINPHFIFNCMNSIHHFMHKNDIKSAGDYLIKFSQLIRMVLENSSHDTITLKEELHSLELYIQLEQLRLDNRFVYEIVVDENMKPEQYEIPALFIQPFVENAIWHELTKISGDGKLTVHVDRYDEGIRCRITSEGTGQALQQSVSSLTEGIKKTSLGLRLIRERMELMNRMGEGKAYFTAIDISEHEKNRFGHHVEVYIPVAGY